MAFRASNQIQADGLAEAKRLANQLKTYVTDVKAQSAAGPISGNLVADLMSTLVAYKARFTAISAIPGIAAYAQAQENDNTYQVGTEFTTMMNAIDALGSWIISNVNTNNWVTFSASGVSVKTFTSAQTTGLRTQIDSLTATIS